MENLRGTLAYTLQLQDYADQRLHVRLDARIDAPVDAPTGAPARWSLTAWVVDNGITVENFQILDASGAVLDVSIDDQGQLEIPATRFTVSYTICSVYRECMGADKLHNFIYPYMNDTDREIFFGTGALIYPHEAELPEPAYAVRVSLEGLPEGFGVFSSLLLDELTESISDDKLASFFLYAGEQLQPLSRIYTLKDGTLFELRCLIERGKTIPFTVDELMVFAGEYLEFVENVIAPYAQLPRIHLLMLQAPPNFIEIANNRSFATGENVPNGIIAYAPQDPAYLKRTFGHQDYGYYLYDGFVHEMMHFYTTCSSNRVKAALFASPDCSRHDCFMIGEVLAGYFHNMYMKKYYKGDIVYFIRENILDALNHWKLNQQRSYLLDWFAFDVHLRYEHDITLLELFREMVSEKQRDRTPYGSLEWVFEVLHRMGIHVDEETRAILSKNSAHPDYARITGEALRLLGYDLIHTDGKYQIVASEHNVPELVFDFAA